MYRRGGDATVLQRMASTSWRSVTEELMVIGDGLFLVKYCRWWWSIMKRKGVCRSIKGGVL